MGDDDNHWCDLGFAEPAVVFKGPIQNAHVLSVDWVAARLFCPGCGADRLEPFPNNAPVADFACPAEGQASLLPLWEKVACEA